MRISLHLLVRNTLKNLLKMNKVFRYLLAFCVCVTIGGILKLPLYVALYYIHDEVQQYIFEFCAVVALLYVYYLIITKITSNGK